MIRVPSKNNAFFQQTVDLAKFPSFHCFPPCHVVDGPLVDLAMV